MEDLCFGYTSSVNGAECTISMTLGEEEAAAWLDFLRGGRLEIRDGAYRITAERVRSPTIPRMPINRTALDGERMPFLRDLRRRLHRYRFEELPPETQEAILQVREYERSRAADNARKMHR